MRRSIYFLGLTLLTVSLLFAAKPQSFNLDPYNPEYDPNTVLVKFHDEAQVNNSLAKTAAQTGIVSVDRLIGNYSVKSVEKVFVNAQPIFGKRTFTDPSGKEHELKNMDKIYRIKYDAKKDPKELSEEIANDPSVEYAEPDYYVYMMIAPDDPFYASGDQWHIDAVNAPAAWDSTTADTNQVISIIDTGVDWDHPDLDSKIWINRDEYLGIEGVDDDGNGYIDDIRGWDFINDDNDPNDDNSHGTHVAGIAAAETNNAVGVAGIAWGAKIMPIKVLQSTGSGNSSDVAAAIDYAAANGATVINMSLGTYGESQTVKTALENAYAYAVLVAAAGNDGYKVDPPFPPLPIYAPMFPACYSFVLGAEASTETSAKAGFSNYDPSGPVEIGNDYGHNYEVRAPGSNIYSSVPNGNYRGLSGTSMASPVVAGAVALMKSYKPSQSTEEIFARLIQSSNSGILDVYNALDYELIPNLAYISHTIVDTLPGCDQDDNADAGETIKLYIKLKNAGGSADSVWCKTRIAEFEDTSLINITDSISYIGSMSAYSELTGQGDPFIVELSPDISNNRIIKLEYELLNKDSINVTDELEIKVQRGIELSGIYDQLIHLHANKYYVVTDNTVFDSLIIDPGVTLRINNEVSIIISSYIEAIGKPDSLIIFTRNENAYWSDIEHRGSHKMEFEYCVFEHGRGNGNRGIPVLSGVSSIENCQFRYNSYSIIHYENANISRNKFVLNSANLVGAICNTLAYNVFVNNSSYQAPLEIYQAHTNSKFVKDNIMFNNTSSYYGNDKDITIGGTPWGIYHLSPNYFGVNDSAYIAPRILDFMEASHLPVVLGDSATSSPSTKCHGVAWKVEINDVLVNRYDNPYNSSTGLGIVGAELLKFDIYFNRAMDTTVTPFLTFGVREPYTQHPVNESSSWSADSMVWTAYYNIDDETGDGIQRVRVALAEDTDNFEIPTEDSRFEFVIQAAAAAGVKFTASAGIGKVDLEWAKAAKKRTLGYNVYRYEALTDSTWSDTTLLNDELVTDTLYTDYDVIPDSTYYYLFTQVQTDMSEGDYSKKVTATVLSAANGDANGDLNVNVLDVISIVSYILEGNPSPFLFDAADINGDGNINVLDIIGVVNVILNPGMGKAAYVDASETLFYLKDNRIHASSNGALGGYQFIINGDIEELNIESAYPMEVATTQLNEDELLVMVYSLNGNLIPEGNNIILSLSATDDLVFSDLVVSDTKGNLVLSSFGSMTDIIVPAEFALNQNYPNPFNAGTVICYELPEVTDVELAVYNLLGQKVYDIHVSDQRAGYYKYQWNGLDRSGNSLPSGLYVYKIIAGEFTDSKKMILMK